MFLALWQRERVDASGVAIDADANTGIYFVTHGASGHEFSYLRAGSAASRMRPSDLPLPVIRSSKVLHVSGISQAISASACDAVFAAIDAAREAGARISFDSNLRPKLWPLPRARAVIVATMRAVRLVPAEPGRRRPAVRQGAAGGDSRLVPCPGRAGRRAEDGRRRRLGIYRRDARAHRRHARRRDRRDRCGRLLRRRIRGTARRGRHAVCGGALRQCRGGVGDDRIRRGRAAAAARRRGALLAAASR